MAAVKKKAIEKSVKRIALKKAARPPKKTMWHLRLYVAGNTPNSVAAFANLKEICEKHLKGEYDIEVVDLLRNPQLAKGDQIVAIPTLVRKLPSAAQADHWGPFKP